MNILYQKTKLLGKPFRTAEDEWWNDLGFDEWQGFYSLNAPDDIADSFDWSTVDFGIDPATEDRSDINAIIEAGNGYLGGSGSLDFLKAIPKSLWTGVKGAFTKPNGELDYGRLAMAGGTLLGMTGLNKAQTGGYKGTIPKMTAVREQIAYDDPNRRPGAGGRKYFTDTQYAKTPAEVDAAKAAVAEQAKGILAGYKPATAPEEVKSIFATPWEKAAATGATTNTGVAAALPAVPNALDIAKQTYPEKFVDNSNSPTSDSGGIGLAAGGPAMKQPRYLQGITDGMEDKIDTSIDGKQPAKLSHGEFVIPADVVSHLGNGNSDAGAKKLYQMMDRIRQARTGTKKQGKQINPDKFMPGGQVGYQSGGIVAFQSGGATNTTTESNLANWAGDYVTDTLGKAQTAADQPYQAYTGPLTAGASDLQSQAFSGIKSLAQTGYTPTTFTTGTFDSTQAAQYMNPYISQALNPQLKELRRQSQISNLGTLAKAGTSGIMGGARRDLMESENMRNLLGKQADVLGQGYATAYDKAMGQFNAEQDRSLGAQKASEASRTYSADYSRNLLGDMAALGKTQRDIDAEGVAADKAEFEKQRDYDLTMQQYKLGLLQKLPVESKVTTPNTNPILEALASSGTLLTLLQQMGLAPKATTSSTGTTSAASSGTTGTVP